MPTYKLTYFNLEGVAEKVRLAFKLGGIPFEDHRIEFSDWPALKPQTPGGTLPILSVDGAPPLTQSGAMLRYVGILGNLIPTNPEHVFAVEEIIGINEDISRALAPSMYVMMRPENFGLEDRSEDERKAIQAKLRARLATDTLPKLLALLDEKLAANRTQSGFAVGAHPTIADCEIFPLISRLKKGVLDGIPADITDSFPHITKHFETVSALPQLH